MEFSNIPDGKKPMNFSTQEVFYNNLPAEKKTPVVELLRREISEQDQEKIRAEIAADPENWISPYHFFFGMSIRNLLRQKGFGEDYWPIWNLDDIYVWLLEEAVRR